MKKIFFLVVVLVVSFNTSAVEIKKIQWGTEMWKRYTDKDGSGIYTQVFTKVFESEGLELEVSYMPFARSLHLVKTGKLDFAGGTAKEQEANPDYIQARYPVAVSRFNVFFRKSTLQEWEPQKSLKDRKIVATPKVASSAGLDEKEVHVVTSRNQALKMVLNNRSEFYVDDEKVLETTLQENQKLFNPNDYRVETISTNGWYMRAPNTPRGKKVIEIYERGTKRLYDSGELQKIYERLNFSTPVLE